MENMLSQITTAMSRASKVLGLEHDRIKISANRLAAQESRYQTRRYKAFRIAFEALRPSLQEMDHWQEIEPSLSSISRHIESLEARTTPSGRSFYVAQMFGRNKEERLEIFETLENETEVLRKIVCSAGVWVDEVSASEMDKVGPDGELSEAMKSCWKHIRNIYKCVALQPQTCECARHLSDLRLHRQVPDEQIGVDVVFHWGPRVTESRVLDMQEANISHQQFLADCYVALEVPRSNKPGKSWDTSSTRRSRTLCHSLEDFEPRVLSSNSEGYLVTASTNKSHSSPDDAFRSLESILMEKPTVLRLAQRLSIAHAIASSHLRLHPTQWLGHQWHSRDIVFAIKDGRLLLEQPFLRRGSSRDNAGDISTFSSEEARWDETTHTLGILLLELCFNKTIASFAQERDHIESLSSSPDKFELVESWYKEVHLRAHDDYEAVVGWCLKKRFDRLSTIDEVWRQDMQDKVIRPLEKLCHDSISTSPIFNLEKLTWKLRIELERLLVICEMHDKDPLYQTLALDEEYCPDNALEDLIRGRPELLQRVYVASYLHSFSWKSCDDVRDIRQDNTSMSKEAQKFYDGAWFDAWHRFTGCCRGGEALLSLSLGSNFPLDEDGIVKLFTGQDPGGRKASAPNYQRADMAIFRSSQYYFCAARLTKDEQRHDHALNDKCAQRLPFTSIRRIGSGSSANVYRVTLQRDHYDGREQTLAMKVLPVGSRALDEWRHTLWMRAQLRTQKCIMRAKASLRSRQHVLVFYESAECDLRSYMTREDPSSEFSRKEMFDMIREIADAMHYLHQGLAEKTATMACVHNDMKTENILVTRQKDDKLRFKLTDFGISSVINEHSLPKGDPSNVNFPAERIPRQYKTSTKLAEGMSNASPEMYNNGLVDASADIWAFGTVLAEFMVWLFEGRQGLKEFELAKSSIYGEYPDAYFCKVNSILDMGDSTSRINTAMNFTKFVLKKEIGQWFRAAVTRVQENVSVPPEEWKMLEDCWWLLEHQILVCDANLRGKSEDVLCWLGMICDGTLVLPAGIEINTESSGFHDLQTVQGAVPIKTPRSERVTPPTSNSILRERV